jgi:hypothetical protein
MSTRDDGAHSASTRDSRRTSRCLRRGSRAMPLTNVRAAAEATRRSRRQAPVPAAHAVGDSVLPPSGCGPSPGAQQHHDDSGSHQPHRNPLGAGFPRVLRGSTGFCGVLRGSVLRGSTRFYEVLRGSTRFCGVRFCAVLRGSVMTRRSTASGGRTPARRSTANRSDPARHRALR